MINKKLILENAIRFGFINELKKSKKNQSMIDYAVQLGFAIDQGDEVIFPWNKTGDPTYETWLLNQLKDKNHAQKGLVNFEEDGNKLEMFITEFDRLKKQRQITGIDINQLDFSGVKKIVLDNKEKVSRKAIERGDVDIKAKSGYELKIFKKKSDANEVAEIGQRTYWCTKELDKAESHLAKGAIYIVFKNGNPYAQLHVETKQYMDIYDSPINSEMWQELRENIPFINQLINRMGIVKAMTVDEIYSWIESKGPHIEGDLNLEKTEVTNLPDSLVSVGGDLNLYRTKIKKLPESLKSIGGKLNLVETQVTQLPESLKSIGGNLYLYKTQVAKLPDSLESVGGNLNLHGTKVTKLPDSLVSVGGDLDLYGTQIIKLPDSLKYVGGNLKLIGTPITELPDSLESVGQNLILTGTKIKEIPDSLKYIGSFLIITKTEIKDIPDGLKIGKGIVDKYIKL